MAVLPVVLAVVVLLTGIGLGAEWVEKHAGKAPQQERQHEAP